MKRLAAWAISAGLTLPLARLAGEGGARRDSDGRVRVGAPSAPHEFCTAGAPTLTRLATARHPLPPSGRGFSRLMLATITIWALAAALLTASPALAEPGGTVVAFGDSITKGFPNPWPDDLEARLQERFAKVGFTVINAGIPGNRLLSGVALNPDGLSRFSRDALDRNGVKFIILLEGINDIGQSDIDHAAGAGIPDIAASIIAADRLLIAEAHARHVKIFGGTLTPFTGIAYPGYFSPAGEAQRQAVNRWIRSGDSGFDAVIDFDAALRDPADPTKLRPQYDSGDHLHPNATGEAAMAAVIDLALFQ